MPQDFLQHIRARSGGAIAELVPTLLPSRAILDIAFSPDDSPQRPLTQGYSCGMAERDVTLPLSWAVRIKSPGQFDGA
jgi:hypothetical protein